MVTKLSISTCFYLFLFAFYLFFSCFIWFCLFLPVFICVYVLSVIYISICVCIYLFYLSLPVFSSVFAKFYMCLTILPVLPVFICFICFHLFSSVFICFYLFLDQTNHMTNQKCWPVWQVSNSSYVFPLWKQSAFIKVGLAILSPWVWAGWKCAVRMIRLWRRRHLCTLPPRQSCL